MLDNGVSAAEDSCWRWGAGSRGGWRGLGRGLQGGSISRCAGHEPPESAADASLNNDLLLLAVVRGLACCCQLHSLLSIAAGACCIVVLLLLCCILLLGLDVRGFRHVSIDLQVQVRNEGQGVLLEGIHRGQAAGDRLRSCTGTAEGPAAGDARDISDTSYWRMKLTGVAAAGMPLRVCALPHLVPDERLLVR